MLEMIQKENLDFVDLCLPTYMHADMTIKALNAGKHVHCEKPMALNATEAAEMLKTSKQTGKTLMVALNNRFTPYAQYVKNLALSGWFGEIYFAKCGWLRRAGVPRSGWFGEKKLAGGGALIDLGVHFIDLTMYIMGYPELESVTSKTYGKLGGSEFKQLYTFDNKAIDPSFKFEVEDLAAGMICLKNDAAIQFEISWASNIEKEYHYYDIYGDKGGMSFRFDMDGGDKPSLKLFHVLNGQLADTIPTVSANAYTVGEFSHFIESIRSGKVPQMAPPEQGVAMMKIIDAIYASSRDRKQIVFYEE
jgi:predicted dehydrogenase